MVHSCVGSSTIGMGDFCSLPPGLVCVPPERIAFLVGVLSHLQTVLQSLPFTFRGFCFLDIPIYFRGADLKKLVYSFFCWTWNSFREPLLLLTNPTGNFFYLLVCLVLNLS
jgi:hypothetical protein